MYRYLLSIVLLSHCCVSLSAAQSTKENEIASIKGELEQLKRTLHSMSATISHQEALIQKLSDSQQSSAGVVTNSVSSATARRSITTYTPDIGVVADMVASFTESKEDSEGNDRLSVREVEIVFGHDVDPYGRLDATIAFSDAEDPALEEAYYSAWGLPFDLKAKIGRLRPRIGATAPLHRDTLETVDEPLVIQRYLGIEGLSRTGIELSGYLPLPWEDVTHELIFGIMEGGIGEEGTLFGSSRRSPSLYARLRNSADFSDTTFLDFGSTFLAGSADADSSFEARAVGIDLTLTHALTPIERVKVRAEMYVQDRSAAWIEDEEGIEDHLGIVNFEDERETSFNKNPLGAYVLADYRFEERWSLGGRWDWVEPVNTSEQQRSEEQFYSAYLTYHQSEFARWRMQYQHALLLDETEDDRLFLQAVFAIGIHKHQLQ